MISIAPEQIRDLDLTPYSEAECAALQVNMALQEVGFDAVYGGSTVTVLTVPLWLYDCINFSTR